MQTNSGANRKFISCADFWYRQIVWFSFHVANTAIGKSYTFLNFLFYPLWRDFSSFKSRNSIPSFHFTHSSVIYRANSSCFVSYKFRFSARMKRFVVYGAQTEHGRDVRHIFAKVENPWKTGRKIERASKRRPSCASIKQSLRCDERQRAFQSSSYEKVLVIMWVQWTTKKKLLCVSSAFSTVRCHSKRKISWILNWKIKEKISFIGIGWNGRCCAIAASTKHQPNILHFDWSMDDYFSHFSLLRFSLFNFFHFFFAIYFQNKTLHWIFHWFFFFPSFRTESCSRRMIVHFPSFLCWKNGKN